MRDDEARKRYTQKLSIIDGYYIDPYETEKKDWEDNVDLWPTVTHINVF